MELVYDLNNNASIRFLEGLLYKSGYYNPEKQSILLSLINQDDLSFALSTPRLPGDKSLQLRISFADEAINELFKMKQVPQTLSYIAERPRLTPDQEERFKALQVRLLTF